MPIRVNRFDKGELRKAERTPQGFLRAPAFATRTGVFTYRTKDGGIRRELRHPEDVFAADSLKTLASIPFTDDHPPVALLDALNTRQYMVGYTGDDVGQDDKFVTAVVTVTDDGMIRRILSGKVEVSCGYTCEHEDGGGTYEGEPYDVRQRNITYNHLAGVDRGRAGPRVRLILDSADAVQVDPSNPLEDDMEKILINGVEVEVTKDVADKIKAERAAAATKAKADADAATVALTAEKARGDKAEAKADGLTSELDKTKAALAAKADGADPVKVNAAAKARVRVLKVAERVLAKDVFAKADGMDDKALMVEVIKAECKGVNLDGKSDAYIEARFDGIVESLETSDGGKKEAGTKLALLRKDGGADEGVAEAARKRQMERSQNAWKGEVPAAK